MVAHSSDLPTDPNPATNPDRASTDESLDEERRNADGQLAKKAAANEKNAGRDPAAKPEALARQQPTADPLQQVRHTTDFRLATERGKATAEAARGIAGQQESDALLRESEERFQVMADSVRESEARYQLLFENSPLPKWLYDAETLAFLAVNNAAVRHYGYSREEFLRLTIKDIRPPEDVARMVAAAQAPPADPGAVTRWRHRKKDGTRIEVEISSQALQLDGRNARLVVAQDVTARSKGEEALRESEEKFRQLAENIHEVFWVTSADKHEILYVSPAYETIWGQTVKSLMEDPGAWMRSIHQDDRARVTAAATTGQQAGTYDELYRILRPDGRQRWIRDRAFPVKGNRGVERIVGIAEDVTELRQAEEQLRQAQKMEALGSLAGGVAHDFNNLLSVVLCYSEMLASDLAHNDPMRADLEEIQNAGRRATELTRQLLAFSRQQVLQPKIVDLSHVLTGMETMLRRLLGEDLELTVVRADGLAKIRVDPGQIEQVIMNLVVNSRDSMPNGGRLTVETANVVLDAAYAAEHDGVRPGPHVMLAVTDTGTGIDKGTQARMFEPFFTTKAEGMGTGLGLSTVLGIVQQSEGTIWVRSEVGEGTTFKAYFPACEGTAHAEAPPAEVRPLRGTETVLLVEDEPAVRTVIRTLLRKHGYQVLEAQNGGEALLNCEQHEGQIHLLVTDLVMPRMNGRQLAARLTKARPEMKVLFMSGYTDKTVVARAILEPGLAYLQKPITPDAILHKVREVLGAP